MTARLATANRAAREVMRYWHEDRGEPSVSAWPEFDEAAGEYVVKSNLVNGRPPHNSVGRWLSR
jgi:hypothetical protein